MNRAELDSINRFERIGMVATALTGDVRAQEIAEIVVHQGMAGMGAVAGVVVIRRGDVLEPEAVVGSTQVSLHRFGPLRLDRQLPLCLAAGRGEEVWLGSRDEGLVLFPDLAITAASSRGWAATPLMARGRPFGALGLSFDRPPVFDTADRQFVRALTDLAALALSRLFAPGEPGAGRRPGLAELLAAAISVHGDGALAVDADGVIVGADGPAHALFGYQPEQLTGLTIEQLVPVGMRPIHLVDRRRYQADPSPRPFGSGLGLVGRRADGTEIPLDVSLSPCATEHGLLVVAVVRRRPFAGPVSSPN